MRPTFTIVKIINVAALLFLLLGGYGLAITGALQVLAAVVYFAFYPKDKLIYVYFGLVAVFFLIWDRHSMDCLFAIPICLIFLLTYIIHFQKRAL